MSRKQTNRENGDHARVAEKSDALEAGEGRVSTPGKALKEKR